MKNRLRSQILKTKLIVALATIIVGCSSAPKMTTERAIHIDTSALEIQRIRSSITRQSALARSLSVDGDITVDQNGDQNSASFTMKSKRLDGQGNRIDSLSIIVSGPFGIKLARFMASPVRYQFYDILHGETLSGKTDAQSLEDLTHLHGISLETMSDIIYGLPGNIIEGDSAQLYTISTSQHLLIMWSFQSNSTALIALDGPLPNDSNSNNLFVRRIEQWNGSVDPIDDSIPPLVSVQFSEPVTMNGIVLAKHIEAKAGSNALTLEYSEVELNPSSLTVKIKMPE